MTDADLDQALAAQPDTTDSRRNEVAARLRKTAAAFAAATAVHNAALGLTDEECEPTRLGLWHLVVSARTAAILEGIPETALADDVADAMAFDLEIDWKGTP